MLLKVANPVPGGVALVSAQKAAKYIRRGQAEMSQCGEYVFFTGHRHLSACRSVSLAQEMGYDRAASGRLATLDEIRNLPCMMATKLLTINRKRAPKVSNAN